MRADHLLLLQEAIPGTSCVSAEIAVRPLREVKSDGRAAAAPGRRRRGGRGDARRVRRLPAGGDRAQVADAAAAAFRAEGGEEVVFTIVGAGPNGAFPHHHAGHRNWPWATRS